MKHNEPALSSIDTASQRNFLKTGSCFLFIYLLFVIVGYSGIPLSFELKRAIDPPRPDKTAIAEKSTDSSRVADTAVPKPVLCVAKESRTGKPGTPKKVLLIGDSELDGLRNPVYKYCVVNKHELVASVVWYGSSTKQWSTSDTLDFFLKKYKPDFVFIALGLNELFMRDLEKRRGYIRTILDKIKNAGAQYFWIGPAAWKPDYGITRVLEEENGRYFYPSATLTLARAKDHRHPSREASVIWFDKVADSVSLLKEDGIDLSCRKDTTVSYFNSYKSSPMIVIKQNRG